MPAEDRHYESPTTIQRLAIPPAVALPHIAGRPRHHNTKILPGYRADVELSPHVLAKGRTVRRYRAGEAYRAYIAPV
jgi:hypothetical protein